MKLKELWERRKALLSELNQLSAAAEGRDATDYEQSRETELTGKLAAVDKEIDALAKRDALDSSMQRFAGMRSQDLTARDEEVNEWARRALLEKSMAPLELRSNVEGDYSVSQPGLERRDTLTSTATQALGSSVYGRFIDHMAESTSVLRAGGLLITTNTGEDLIVPRGSSWVTSNLIAEGNPITESDPGMAIATLKAYKFAAFWQLSRELVDDTPFNLLDALARGAAQSLAQSYGAYLATGTGTAQPAGFADPTVGAVVGKQGPAGTTLTLGAQTTVGMGTDILNDLIASLAEPYLQSSSIGWLGRNASFAVARKLRDGQSRPVLDMTPTVPGASVNMLGYPGYVDAFIPAMAVSARSLAFGDWSRFAVRMVNGVRLERSDEFAFSSDLVSFKAVVRLDSRLLDTGAIKLFQNSAT